jgi:ribosomal protein L37AE/L43A
VNWLRRFMMGRYGADQLTFATLLLSMILAMFTRGRLWPLSVLGFLLLIWAYFRMLSRNISARAQENGIFLRYWYRVKGFFQRFSARLGDRTHRYYRCPQCGQKLRVPRGRGRIVITCPKCRHEFIRKS